MKLLSGESFTQVFFPVITFAALLTEIRKSSEDFCWGSWGLPIMPGVFVAVMGGWPGLKAASIGSYSDLVVGFSGHSL